MSNKVKIIISILAAVIVLAIAGLSVFLVLTATSTSITSNTFVLNYDGSDLALDVKVTAEYYDIINADSNPSIDKVVETKADFQISPYVTGTNLSKSINLGNISFVPVGSTTQYTQYVLIFVLTVDHDISKSEYDVTFAYQDTGDLDQNIKINTVGTFTGSPDSTISAGSFNGYIASGGTAWSGATTMSAKQSTLYKFNSAPINYHQLTFKVTISPNSTTADASMDGNFNITISKAA